MVFIPLLLRNTVTHSNSGRKKQQHLLFRVHDRWGHSSQHNKIKSPWESNAESEIFAVARSVQPRLCFWQRMFVCVPVCPFGEQMAEQPAATDVVSWLMSCAFRMHYLLIKTCSGYTWEGQHLEPQHRQGHAWRNRAQLCSADKFLPSSLFSIPAKCDWAVPWHSSAGEWASCLSKTSLCHTNEPEVMTEETLSFETPTFTTSICWCFYLREIFRFWFSHSGWSIDLKPTWIIYFACLQIATALWTRQGKSVYKGYFHSHTLYVSFT